MKRVARAIVVQMIDARRPKASQIQIAILREGRMRNVLFGMIIGAVLGFVVSSHAAFISGGDNEICDDPEVDYKNKEIQCSGLPEPY